MKFSENRGKVDKAVVEVPRSHLGSLPDPKNTCVVKNMGQGWVCYNTAAKPINVFIGSFYRQKLV